MTSGVPIVGPEFKHGVWVSFGVMRTRGVSWMARFLHPDIRMQTFLNDLPISSQVIASVSTSAGTTSEAGSIHSPLGATSVDHSIMPFCVRCKAVKCSGYEGYFPLHIGARKWLDSKFYQ